MTKMRDAYQQLRDAGYDARLVSGEDENGVWRVTGHGADVHVLGTCAAEVAALLKLAKEDDRRCSR